MFRITATSSPVPAKHRATKVLQPSASDSLSAFIDDPFNTWQSTLVFVLLVGSFCGMAVFLGIRYIEIFRGNIGNCCKAPLTLEGQWSKQTDSTRTVQAYRHEKNPSPKDNGMRHEEQANIRRSRTRDIQATTVEIGEVHKGRIAQRRASSHSAGRNADSQ